MTDLTKLSAEQQKVRESLAKQLELLSKASDTACAPKTLSVLTNRMRPPDDGPAAPGRNHPAAGGVRSWEATERR